MAVYELKSKNLTILLFNCKLSSRREDVGLQEVVADTEEVVKAAQGLKEVTKMIKELSGFAHSTLTTTLSH